MADVVITPSDVGRGAGAQIDRNQVGGAAGNAGHVVYLDAATGRMKLAQCDGTEAEAAARGVLLNQMVAGQPVAVLTAGPVVLGGGLVPGHPYYLSDAAGGIKPLADLAEGERIVMLGYAVDEQTLYVSIVDTGATIAP